MRRKGTLKKYFIFSFTLLLLASFPLILAEELRGRTIAVLSFLWKTTKKNPQPEKFHEKEKEAENHLLRIEIGKLKALLEHEYHLAQVKGSLSDYRDPKRYEEACNLLELQTNAIAARVIYRDPASWSGCLWVDVGEITNQKFGRTIVSKNSPVVIGHSLIGVVDYVGKKQSRIRLITDTGLKPAVRAVRGHPVHAVLNEHVEVILRNLDSVPISKRDKEILHQKLQALHTELSSQAENWYLAKGILQGEGSPLWKSTKVVLKGIGFNYDFADGEGPARDLRTGQPDTSQNFKHAVPIIQNHDLLVTTGLDGIFPPGLRVAEVTKIYPMREGAYTYEIEAVPVCSSFNELQILFILPPICEDIEFLSHLK